MKIAGVMAISDFPLWRKCFDAMSAVADEIYVRFDGRNGDPEIMRELYRMTEQPVSKIRRVFVSSDPWRVPQWREDCISLAAEGKPDIIICPDQDEIIGDNPEDFRRELEAFWKSDKKTMRFKYLPLITVDNRIVNNGVPYPVEPHIKAFKWKDGLSYFPYHGNGMPARYVNAPVWDAETRISHYCCWTKAMESRKHWRNPIPGKVVAEKAVTLLGFGPSSHGEREITGEVWSLNDCYQGVAMDILKRTTRVYELHSFAKREFYMAKDGHPHYWHLNRLGEMGHRIIMQMPHPQIWNSEAFPLQRALAEFPFKYYVGTPPYMVVHALLDGFTEIRIYGFDQMDWQHRLQRECFAFWIGMAAGMGKTVSGEITFLNQHTRLYGYEWGPEWDDKANEIMWQGFPFEIKPKEDFRAIIGDMHWQKPKAEEF